MKDVRDRWWSMMVACEELISTRGAGVMGRLLGRWEDAEGRCALVGFEAGEVVGLLFGLKRDRRFRPIEARFMPASLFVVSDDFAQELLTEWGVRVSNDAPTLATTGIRDLPMGRMAARLIDGDSDALVVPVPDLLTDEVVHGAANNLGACGFRSRRELLSRVQQLKATFFYARAIQEGQQAPLEFVARHLDLAGDGAKARAGTLIQYARKNGYLSDPVSPGRAGGEFTRTAEAHVAQIVEAGGHHG